MTLLKTKQRKKKGKKVTVSVLRFLRARALNCTWALNTGWSARSIWSAWMQRGEACTRSITGLNNASQQRHHSRWQFTWTSYWKYNSKCTKESICNIESQGNACGIFGTIKTKIKQTAEKTKYAVREFAIMRWEHWEHHMLMVYL